MSINFGFPFGMSHVVESTDPENDNNKKHSRIRAIVSYIKNIGHIMGMTNASMIADFEAKGAATNNRFDLKDKVIRIHKGTIFLFKKPTKNIAKDITILDMISSVGLYGGEVVQSEIMQIDDKTYIAFGLMPNANDGIIYGYRLHMVTIDNKSDTLNYDTIITAPISDNEPRLSKDGNKFILITTQGTIHGNNHIPNGVQSLNKQYYNPITGDSK